VRLRGAVTRHVELFRLVRVGSDRTRVEKFLTGERTRMIRYTEKCALISFFMAFGSDLLARLLVAHLTPAVVRMAPGRARITA
jgi:hypothetical protein